MTMKKTNILAALLLLMAGVQQTWAQKVVLHKADGEVFEYSVSKLDSMAVVGRYDTDNKAYVDLGLPSGTLWATCNVGASSPGQYGDYFAWGETTPKNDYSWETYSYCNGSDHSLTKYCTNSDYGDEGFTDDIEELLPADDAATVCWGNDWQMPSEEQFNELIDPQYTTTSWVTYGRLITSKSNGRSIFLPAAGYRSEADIFFAGGDNGYGCYWSRSVYNNVVRSFQPGSCSFAHRLLFNSDEIKTNTIGRSEGFCVRPVRKK